MLTTMFGFGAERQNTGPQEGDLFKIVQIYGKTFELRYGFYEERDRHTRFAEPVAIYPNFKEQPQYTEGGVPFITEMQTPCEYFVGRKCEDSGCGDCAFYEHGDELIGVCNCPHNKKRPQNEG